MSENTPHFNEAMASTLTSMGLQVQEGGVSYATDRGAGLNLVVLHEVEPEGAHQQIGVESRRIAGIVKALRSHSATEFGKSDLDGIRARRGIDRDLDRFAEQRSGVLPVINDNLDRPSTKLKWLGAATQVVLLYDWFASYGGGFLLSDGVKHLFDSDEDLRGLNAILQGASVCALYLELDAVLSAEEV